MVIPKTISTAPASASPAVLPNASDQQASAILLGAGGWTLLPGVNLMLSSLLQNPCSTTMLSIWKETRSLRWTAVATLLPSALAVSVTAATATGAHLLGA